MFETGGDPRDTAAALVSLVPPPQRTPDAVDQPGGVDPRLAGTHLATARDRVAALGTEGVLDVAAAAARLASFAEAVSLLAAAVLAETAEAESLAAGRSLADATVMAQASAAAELTTVTPMAPRTAEARLAHAEQVVQHLPRSWLLLATGDLDAIRVRRLSDGTVGLTPDASAVVESAVLSRAVDQTPSQVARAVTRARLLADPEPHRAAERLRSRRTVYTRTHPDDAGLADLVLTGPTPVIAAAFARIDAAARERVSAGDSTTLSTARFDVGVELLSGGADVSGIAAGADVQLAVVAPAETALGLGDEPGELIGPTPLGPVPASMVRELAGDAAWRRWFTDTEGVVTGVGRSAYRPPAALADLIRARDRTCRFPMCSRRAERCDIDHTVRYPEGETSADNLSCLCRRHHRLKHETAWTVESDDASGELRWTTPTGRTATTSPPRHPVPVPVGARTDH